MYKSVALNNMITLGIKHPLQNNDHKKFVSCFFKYQLTIILKLVVHYYQKAHQKCHDQFSDKAPPTKIMIMRSL
jgi:hypothetical protein